MVTSYFMPEHVEDAKLPNKLELNDCPNKALAAAGVWAKQIKIEPGWEDRLTEAANTIGLKYRDKITISRTTLPNYEEKMRIFFEEHLHTDPEVRFVKAGSGYFDDRWIRLFVEQGDFVFLPAGIYHRFIVDTKDYLEAIRLFKEEPQWQAYNRSAESDSKVERQNYLSAIAANNNQ